VLKLILPRTILAALAFLPLVLAQSPLDLFSKAPPDVDAALRDRIKIFFQAHVDGKPRRAEEVVAEDSKDFFYNMKKPKFLSYEIHKIDYAKDFNKAKAIIVVETYVPVLGFGSKPMKVPVTTLWKIENGLWYWYIDDDLINSTPFGKMGTPPGVSANPNGGLPDISNTPNAATLWQQVKPDRSAVELKAGEPSSAQVTIHNGMPGSVTLELRKPPVPGLEVKLDRAQIPAGEKAIVSFHYEPAKNVPREAVRVDVVVQPTNAMFPLRITFK